MGRLSLGAQLQLAAPWAVCVVRPHAITKPGENVSTRSRGLNTAGACSPGDRRTRQSRVGASSSPSSRGICSSESARNQCPPETGRVDGRELSRGREPCQLIKALIVRPKNLR